MKRKSGNSLAADYATLAKQIARGKQPTTQPTSLQLSEIKRWPKVFQHRSLGGVASKGHVLALTAAIKKRRSKQLDPIMVWWDGRAWACVDGHHRYEAYMKAEVGNTHYVPVEVFTGTLNQAMGVAAQTNTGDKLPMSRAEKSNAAWHLVTMADMSKSEVAKVSNVSEGTVAAMRRVFTRLDARVNEVTADLTMPAQGDFRDLSWADAKSLAEGRDVADFDRDVVDEAMAQKMAAALRKAFGAQAAKYPETFARALELYDTRLPDALAEWWNTPDDDDDNDEASEF